MIKDSENRNKEVGRVREFLVSYFKSCGDFTDKEVGEFECELDTYVRYGRSTASGDITDPLEYWRDRLDKYPNMYRVVKRLFCLPVKSSFRRSKFFPEHFGCFGFGF